MMDAHSPMWASEEEAKEREAILLRILPGDREMGLYPLTLGRTRIQIGPRGAFYYEEAW